MIAGYGERDWKEEKMWLRSVGMLALASLTAGCMDEPAPWSPDETSQEDAVSDAAAEAVPAGRSCYDALHCLLDLKNWRPGMPTSRGDCTKDMSADEISQSEKVLGCVDANCKAQFESWRDGTGSELGLLYLCMIDKCTVEAAVCIGGHGKKDCGDAVLCLQKCTDPLNQDCTIPCLEDTTEEQSGKTGNILKCVLEDCGGYEELPGCTYDYLCGQYCMEIAS
jgi:hypothetical protein